MWKSNCLLSILILCLWPTLWSQNISIDLSYQDEALTSILSRLQEKYQLDIAYDPVKLESIHLSGHIQTPSVSACMEQLLHESGFTFEQLSPTEILINPVPVIEQKFFAFKGRVIDVNTGEPLSYANVVIPTLKRGAQCNDTGDFIFEKLPAGKVTLEVSFIGYKTLTQSIQLPAGGLAKLGLEENKIALEEIVISHGSSQTLYVADAPGQIQVNPEKIATLSGLGEPDLLKAIQLLPGVKGTNVASSGLYVRGGTPDQNLVLFDGITTYRVDHFFGMFSAFNSRAIQSVDIYRGGFGAKYGGRVSSVIDIKGKAADYEKANASFGASLLNSHAHLEIPLFKNKGSLLVSGRRSYSDIINNPMYHGLIAYVTSSPEGNSNNNLFQRSSVSIDEAYSDNPKVELNLSNTASEQSLETAEVTFYDLNTQLRYRTVNEDVLRHESTPDFQFFDLNGKFNLQLSDKDLFSLTYYQGGDRLLYAYAQETVNGRQIQNLDKLSLRNRGLSSAWSRQWDNRLYSKLNFSWSSYGSHYEYGFIGKDDTSKYTAFIDQRNSIQDYSMRADHSWQIDAQNKFEFGTEFSQKIIQFQFDNDTLRLGDFSTGATLATYAQHTFHPEPNLAMNLGLRATYHQRTNKWYFDPRLSLDYDITDRIFFKAAWGFYHQFTNRVQVNNGLGLGEEFWALADGRDIPVQMANHLILGMSYRHKGFLVDVEAYHKFTEGIITYSYGFAPEELIDKGQERLLAGGQATVKGVDVLVQKNWNKYYTGWVSYSLSRVNEKFLGVNLGEVYPALHDQRHEIKLVNQLSIASFDFATTWMISTGRPYTQADETPRSIMMPDGTSTHGLGLGNIHAERLPTYHRLDVSCSYQFKIGGANSKIGLSIYNFYNQRNIRSRRYFLKHSEYRFIQPSIDTSDVLDLGFSPNIFFNISF